MFLLKQTVDRLLWTGSRRPLRMDFRKPFSYRASFKRSLAQKRRVAFNWRRYALYWDGEPAKGLVKPHTGLIGNPSHRYYKLFISIFTAHTASQYEGGT